MARQDQRERGDKTVTRERDEVKADRIPGPQPASTATVQQATQDGNTDGNKLAPQIIVPAGKSLQSSNYAAGTTGFYVGGDGNVEFNNGTFRGTVVANQFLADLGTEMVLNTGFETNLSNWNLVAALNSTATRVTTDFHSGVASAEIASTSAVTYGYRTDNIPGIIAGRAYAVSAWVKTVLVALSFPTLKVVWLDAGGSTLSTVSVETITELGVWQLLGYSIFVVAPAGATQARVRVDLASSGAGQSFRLDDVSFKTAPLFSSGGFRTSPTSRRLEILRYDQVNIWPDQGEASPGSLSYARSGGTGTRTLTTTVSSPSYTSLNAASLALSGDREDGSALVQALANVSAHDLRLNNVSLPRGEIAYGKVTSATAAITTTKTVIASVTGAPTLLAGRKYRFTAHWRAITGTVLADIFEFTIMLGGTAGTKLTAHLTRVNDTASGHNGGTIAIRYSPGSDVNATVDLCLQRVVGTGSMTVDSATTNPIEILVEDIGA